MNPLVAFGIGLVVGAIIGALAGGFNKMTKDDGEFNKHGEYRCNYSSEDPQVIGTVIPSNGCALLDPPPKTLIIVSNHADDKSIYLMPNDGFDYLSRKKMHDEAAKRFGVIKFVGKDIEPEAKE